MRDEYLGRWLYKGEGVSPGFLRIHEDVVEEVCYGVPPGDTRPSMVMPGFVNSHTHVGDTFAYPAPKGAVEDIVGPGGYKHRMLAEASASQKVAGMQASLEIMFNTGTCAFMDFREEGREGVDCLLSALEGSPLEAKVLGRPRGMDSAAEDIDSILEIADGLAFSSVSDWPMDVLAKASAKCRSAGKTFSLHASESEREDIDTVLGLRPSFLVHMTSASDDDIAACSEAQVPIVVCPTSNSHFGLAPDIPRMLDAGVEVAIGTDNAMICTPDMTREVRAAFASAIGSRRLSPAEAVSLATLSGRKVLNPKGKITTELSTTDSLVVLDVQGGGDPLLDLVSIASPTRVSAVIHGGKVRRRGDWTT